MEERVLVHIDPELRDIMPEFLANRHRDVETLETAVAAGDFDTISRIGHGMKGCGGGFGMPKITEIGGSIETAARTHDSGEVARRIGELVSYLETVEIVYDGDFGFRQ